MQTRTNMAGLGESMPEKTHDQISEIEDALEDALEMAAKMSSALKRIQQFQNDRGIISLNHPDHGGMFSLGRSQINLSKLLGED
jgi:hypothetical protein